MQANQEKSHSYDSTKRKSVTMMANTRPVVNICAKYFVQNTEHIGKFAAIEMISKVFRRYV